MPTPYPNAIGGLSQGIDEGIKLGLLMRQKKTQQLDDSLKAIQLMGVLVKDPHVPKGYKAKIMPAMTDHISNVLEALGGQRIEWDGKLDDDDIKNMSNVSQLIGKVSKNEIPIDQAGPILQSWVDDIETQNEPAAAKAMLEQQAGPLYSRLMEIQPGMGEPSSAMERPYLEAGLSRMNPNLHQKFIEDKRKTEGMGLLGMLKSTETPVSAKPDITEAIAKVTPEYLEKAEGVKKDAYKEDAVMTRIVNAFNADPNVRKVEQMDEFANLIVDVAKSDNPIGHASLETLMARASGEVGNLSEADKKPFGGSRALTEKMKQSFSELYSGKKTPQNLAFISQLAETFKAVGQRKKISLARERANQYSRANRGMGWSAKEIFQTLAPFGEYEEKPVKEEIKSTGKPKTWEELKKQKGY